MTIERVGDFRDTDFAVSFMLRELSVYLQRGGFLSKRNGNDVYLLATLKAAADYSDIFRRKAYQFDDVRFCDHKRNKRGKLLTVRAYFRRFKNETSSFAAGAMENPEIGKPDNGHERQR